MTPDQALDAYEKLTPELKALLDWFMEAAQRRAYYEGHIDARRGLEAPRREESN